METNLIYSKIEHDSVTIIKKDLLESQASLLRSVQHLNNFKTLRKKELMLKLKLQKDVKDIEKGVKKILKEVPKTDNIREWEKEARKEKQQATPRPSNTGIESELEDIQNRLRELEE